MPDRRQHPHEQARATRRRPRGAAAPPSVASVEALVTSWRDEPPSAPAPKDRRRGDLLTGGPRSSASRSVARFAHAISNSTPTAAS